MNASDYQKQAGRTLIDRPDFELTDREWTIIINAVVLARAVGNVCEIVKKGIFHRHGLKDLTIRHPIKEAQKVADAFLRCRMATLPPRVAITNQMVMVVWNVIGLLGEAAEIAELAHINLSRGYFDREKFIKELGDCLWYIAALCSKLDLDMGEIMEINIQKLKVRYPNGFSSSDSIKRVDVIQNEEKSNGTS